MTDKIDVFIRRLNRIGIDIVVSINSPWVYLDYVNGKRVTGKYLSSYKFTLALMPVRKDGQIAFVDTKKIFGLIRKMINEDT